MSKPYKVIALVVFCLIGLIIFNYEAITKTSIPDYSFNLSSQDDGFLQGMEVELEADGTVLVGYKEKGVFSIFSDKKDIWIGSRGMICPGMVINKGEKEGFVEVTDVDGYTDEYSLKRIEECVAYILSKAEPLAEELIFEAKETTKNISEWESVSQSK